MTFNKYEITFFMGFPSSGKTTLLKELQKKQSINYYNVDWRLKGDFKERKKMLEEKKDTVENYITTHDCINWFDWEAVRNDLMKIVTNEYVVLKDVYERDSGKIFEFLLIDKPNIFPESLS